MNKMVIFPLKNFNICNSSFLDNVNKWTTNKDLTNSVPGNIINITKDSLLLPDMIKIDIIKLINSMKNKK